MLFINRFAGLLAALLLLTSCTGGTTLTGTTDGTADGKETRGGDGNIGLETSGDLGSPDVGGDTEPEACTTNEECMERLRDLTPCEMAMCDDVSGECMVGDRKDGSACDDDDACTLDSFCKQGLCIGGTEMECNDKDPCTLDSCAGDTGCVFLGQDGPACDDGNPCTTDDICESGECLGEATECGCESDEDCVQFDDGDLCNGTLQCVGGGCEPSPGTAVVCPGAPGPCASYLCEPASGQCLLESAKDGTACSDGDPCSSGDLCQDGVCASGSGYICEKCAVDADCAYLDGANLCVGTHKCDAGKCVIDPETMLTKPTITCYSAACDPDSGQFVLSELSDGTACDDQNLCTVLDKCAKGVCKGTAKVCDDGNMCTQDTCDTETGCVNSPLTEVPCDDDDKCTAEEWCDAGACVAAEEVVCDDENPCTEDSCDSTEGCLYAALTGVECSDDDSCTSGDTCVDGNCLPGMNICDCLEDVDCEMFEDLDLCNGTLICVDTQCQVDPETVVECDKSQDTACKQTLCSPMTGTCGQVSAPYGSPCDDGNECTLGETCFFGTCLGGIVVSCDDGNPCTVDVCDSDAGCTYEPGGEMECEDGDPCTTGDLCVEGVCSPGTNICGCEEDEDCGQFEDGNLCNGTLSCQDFTCQLAADTVVVCPPGENLCMGSVCDPKTGNCSPVNLPDGTDCDDGNACTAGDACFNGDCVAEEPDCDDGNPCTADVCEPATGCQHDELDGDDCNDGNPCTEGDVCQEGECISGENGCDCDTDEDCLDNEDGNACNGTMFCEEDVCTLDPATVVNCDTSADTQCVKNMCTPESGECEFVELGDGTQCDDGLLCTEEDVCSFGKCSGTLVDCDDDNVCTDDVCVDAQGGCVQVPAPGNCDDGNICTKKDHCQQGLCMGETVVCDDENECTKDMCDPEEGCMFESAPGECDDGDECTENDTCDAGECWGSQIDCNDANVCTEDLCDPAQGCIYYDNEEPCNDDDICTEQDICLGGACAGGIPRDCDDSNDCTEDGCAPDIGCVYEKLNGGECDDGDACTVGDLCSVGKCIGGASLACDDGNPCTTDSCDPSSGCVHESVSGMSCEDGDECTFNEACDDGECVGKAVDCDDANMCTNDLCDPSGGCVYTPVAGSPVCDDGNQCTLTDVCKGGLCVGSDIMECDDGNVCTDDYCDEAAGACAQSFNSDPCEDGDVCTFEDICVNGTCLGGLPVACDDGNDCTEDYCSSDAGGCVFEDNGQCDCQLASDCFDDDNDCNGYPECIENTCVTAPGSAIECDPSLDTACLKNQCVPATGACAMVAMPEGTPCDDADLCSLGDLCGDEGVCSGEPVDCDDGNICTTDGCNSQTGCIHTNVALLCDDGNPCTVDDFCTDGECTGPDYDCDDGNVCTEDLCVASGTGPGCLYLPVAGACDDNNACTEDDTCGDGACTGTPIGCDDGNICTLDSCDPDVGCNHDPAEDETPCDDGESCTANDICESGNCAPGGWLVDCCHVTSDCDDSFACSQETCDGGLCVYTPLACDDGNLCTGDLCVDGQCGHSPLREEVILYNEDFDVGEAAGWHFGLNPDGNAGIFWSVSDYSAHSGGFALYAGNPEDQSYDHGVGDASAYGPPVQLPDDADIDLDFYYRADIEENLCTYDYLVVELQESNGNRTELVPRICDHTEGFTHTSYILDSFSGQAVRIILTFKTVDDVKNTGEGFYVDDVSLIALPRDGCCLYDGDCDDDDLCSADLCQQFECENPWTPGTYFAEEFESGSIDTGGALQTTTWYISSDAPDSAVTWQVDDERSLTTPHALYGGDVKQHNYGDGPFTVTARTPKIVLPSESNAMLTFRLWANIQQADCATDVFRLGVTTAVYGTPAWKYTRCNSTEGFIEVAQDLSDYSGSNVYLHFQFQANAEKNGGEGVYVDHIRVTRAVEDETCCATNGNCSDDDQCTINWCTGTPDGGVCMERDVLNYHENFDDGVANGWTYSGAGNINWQVNDHRSHSKPNSLYCGNSQTQSYGGSQGGTVVASTPFMLLDDQKLSAKCTYFRYLDLYKSSDHCFKVFAHQKNVGNQILLEQVCGGDDDGGMETWAFKSWNLSAFLGKEIRLIFVFQFTSVWGPGLNFDNEGAYIDNVRLNFDECMN